MTPRPVPEKTATSVRLNTNLRNSIRGLLYDTAALTGKKPVHLEELIGELLEKWQARQEKVVAELKKKRAAEQE